MWGVCVHRTMEAARIAKPPAGRKAPLYHASKLSEGTKLRSEVDGREYVVVPHGKSRRWVPVDGKRTSKPKRASKAKKAKVGSVAEAKITKPMPDRKAPLYHASKLPVGTSMSRNGVDWVVRKTTKSRRWVKVPKAKGPRKATKTARTTRHRNRPPRTKASKSKGAKKPGDDGRMYRSVKWGTGYRWKQL